MKIIKIQPDKVESLQEKKQNKVPDKNNNFAAFLEEAKREVIVKEESFSGNSISGITMDPSDEVNLWSMGTNSGTEPSTSIGKSIEAVLDSLKDPANETSKIEDSLHAIDEILDKLPENTRKEVKDFLEELKVVTYTEYVKWRRGDYL
ncbi:MAG: hypothetical protein JRI45_07780 [Deltaproteobacteria bacterium]|nr:hypothetical protein [Deltaproteobacteria bacterium]MBW2068295.1 hypothetical protein [Deltaproteobacteria bacterium]